MQRLSERELQQLFEHSLPQQPIPLDLHQRIQQRVQQELKDVQHQAGLQQRGYSSLQLADRPAGGEACQWSQPVWGVGQSPFVLCAYSHAHLLKPSS